MTFTLIWMVCWFLLKIITGKEVFVVKIYACTVPGITESIRKSLKILQPFELSIMTNDQTTAKPVMISIILWEELFSLIGSGLVIKNFTSYTFFPKSRFS